MSNLPPVRTREIGDIDFTVGDSPRILINMNRHFGDPDGDHLRFTAENLPAGVTMQSEGPWLYGNPTAAFDGFVSVTATDPDGASVTSLLRLVIGQPNRPPTGPDGVPVISEHADTAFSVNLNDHFSDPDGDTLTYGATGLPAGLYVLPGLPHMFGRVEEGFDDFIIVTATDPQGLRQVALFRLTITERQEAPSQEGSRTTDSAPSGLAPSGLVPSGLAPVRAPDPMPDTMPDEAPASTLVHALHWAESPYREIMPGDDAWTDLFILSPTTGAEGEVDVIRNFQQGVDRIHLPGVTTLGVGLVDTDEDGDLDATGIVKVVDGNVAGAYAVLEGFTGTLTLADFDASVIDPELTSSLKELNIMQLDLA